MQVPGPNSTDLLPDDTEEGAGGDLSGHSPCLSHILVSETLFPWSELIASQLLLFQKRVKGEENL